MKKGGTPSSQRAGTQKRLRNKEEEKNPDAKIQREEDGKEAKRNFFSRDTARQLLSQVQDVPATEDLGQTCTGQNVGSHRWTE